MIVEPVRTPVVEIFDGERDPERYTGRDRVRKVIAQMVPTPAREQAAELVPRISAGVFWGLRTPDGLTLALSTEGYSTPEAADHAADVLLRERNRLVVIQVRSDGGSLHSLWIELDGVVVMVGGRVWRGTCRHGDRWVSSLLSRAAGERHIAVSAGDSSPTSKAPATAGE